MSDSLSALLIVVNVQLFALWVLTLVFPNGLPHSRWLRPVEATWDWVYQCVAFVVERRR